MKNKFREPKYKEGDLVYYQNLPGKQFEISSTNYAQNYKERSVYKLRIKLRNGKTIESRWLNENQLQKKSRTKK